MKRAATSKAKNFGEQGSSQTKITNFFARKPGTNNNKTGDKQALQKSKTVTNISKKRRKTTSLKPPNANGRIDYVDLVDSGEDSSSCNLDLTTGDPTGGTSTDNIRGVDNKPKVRGEMQLPHYVRLIDFSDSSTLSNIDEPGTSKRQALRVKNEIKDHEELEEDIYERDTDVHSKDDAEKEAACIDVLNATDDSPGGLITIVPLSKILEDSQSSQEDSTSNNFRGNDEETQRIPIPKARDFSSGNGLSLAIHPSIFSSPAKPQSAIARNCSGLGSSTPSPKLRKTPLKSPKTRVSKLSPVRHLQFKSRSFSKTPTKNPSASTSDSQKSPFRNLSMKSPLKSLWAAAPDPYYLKNFRTVVNSAVGDEHNSRLFNDGDLEIVKNFHCLSKSAQCLYVRLIGRKWVWKQASAFNYEQIAVNLAPVFGELHRHKFVQEISEVDVNLEEMLNLIKQDRMLEFCKQMSIKVPNSSKGKEKCVAFIMKNCKQQQTLKGCMTSILKKAALKEITPAYRVTEATKSLFSRMFILYHPPQYWEQDSDKDSLQLLSILLAELGKVVYPQYKISKSIYIYECREDLLRFQEAWELHSQIQAYILSKQWDEVVDVAKEAMDKLKEILGMPNIIEYSKKLPEHLRAYTAGSLFTRVCWLGVEGFQKLRNYKDANEYLNFLLNQPVYLFRYHGRWYERLVLNSQHLREDAGKLRDIILTALAAPNVRDSYKLDLSTRLAKLKVVSKKKRKGKKRKPKRRPKRKVDREEWVESETSSSEEDSSEDEVDIEKQSTNNNPISSVLIERYRLKNIVPERTIEGEKMPMYDREHGKSVFLGAGNRSLSSVEQFAIHFYETQGYNHCVHAEGAIPSTIYGLLFWHIIYHDEIPDVFYSPYQAAPLDFHFDDFRLRRKSMIDELIDNLRSKWEVEEALELMERTWTSNLNTLSIVNWTLFENIEQLKILVRSMGLPLVAGICDRLSQNYSYYRSGFPDLIVWGVDKCLFAEVKGPGDSLSAKQRVWLDYLISLNADVEVCRVKSVSNKRIRTVRPS